MEKNLNLIGRVMFAIPMAMFGIMHLMKTREMASMVPGFLSWGDHFFVIITGLALMLAAISIIIQRPSRMFALSLGIMLLVFAFSVHLVRFIGGDDMSLSQVLKDLALAGAAFYISSNTRK